MAKTPAIISPNNTSLTYFPSQKRKDAEKTTDFFKQCIDAGASLVTYGGLYNSSGVRSTKREKLINYNLINGIIEKAEIERITNPLRLQDVYFPTVYRNYPILSDNIQLLCGEERNRLIVPHVTVINSDIVNQKLERVNQEFMQYLFQTLQKEAYDEEKVKKDIQDIVQWSKSRYLDRREKMAQDTLDYLFKTQMLREEFSRGFKDLLIVAEEIYIIDVIGGEPILRKANPNSIFTLRSGDSWKIEDSDIIVEESYLPIGEVIDRYYEYLTPQQIKQIEEGQKLTAGLVASLSMGKSTDVNLDAYVQQMGLGNLVTATASNTGVFSGNYDAQGNIRVIRTVWKGMRQIGVLEYFDEAGDRLKKLVPEGYPVREELGEVVTWYWVSEWYEGTKIGNDIYIKMQPCDIQMRHMDNISRSSPGIVGTIMNTNASKARSLVDMGKDYQYLFNAFMHKLLDLFIKSKGRIGKLPLHLMPPGWNMDKIMYYAEYLGWLPIDAFNEGNVGAATGKLAGTMNESSSVIDLSFAQEISQTFVILDFIKRQLDNLCGITPQRRGAIDNRETVGGVERSIVQSSLSTEEWFSVHENTISRALRALLEAAKVAWKDKSFKRQYALDDGSMAILDFDWEMFVESEYGVDVSGSSSDSLMLRTMQSMVPQLINKGAPLSLILDLYRTKNPAALQKKIEEYEARVEAAQQQEMQLRKQELDDAMARQQAILQQELDIKNRELDLEQYKIDMQAQIDLEIAAMQANKDYAVSEGRKGINDEIKKQEIINKEFRDKQAALRAEREQAIKLQIEARKLQLKADEIAAKERLQRMKDDAAMQRERLKAETSLKNKVSGEK